MFGDILEHYLKCWMIENNGKVLKRYLINRKKKLKEKKRVVK